MNKILIVDDEPTALRGMALSLKSFNYDVDEAVSYRQVMQKISKTEYELVITDLRLPGEENGLAVIKLVREHHPLTSILVITAFGSVDSAVKAMQAGADDYVTKDFSRQELALKIKRMQELRKTKLANLRLSKQVESFREKYRESLEPDEIVGESANTKKVMELVRNAAADNDATVLITGESGTGKELIARAIHWNSPRRREKYFMIVDVANLPVSLLESELFGHEKGAFTNAQQLRKGKFEVADGGSVFLDEIGDFSLELQTKLLRFLQEKSFARVGGVQQLFSDVRIIAATNKNLEEMVRNEQFRNDLFFRLNVVRIHLPPLRERREDITLLIDYFSRRLEEQKGRHLNFPEAVKKRMIDYDWPGNIRQLRNFMEGLYVTCPGDIVQPAHLTFDTIPGTQNDSGDYSHLLQYSFKEAKQQLLEEFEKYYLSYHLKLNGGNISQLAGLVGESREGLSKKIKKYGLKTGK